jgi:hypothetical protein
MNWKPAWRSQGGVRRAINDPECLSERNAVQVTLYTLPRVRVDVRHRTRRYIEGIDHGDSRELGNLGF